METLEALQERTGTKLGRSVRLSDNFGKVVKRDFPSDSSLAREYGLGDNVEFVPTELPTVVTLRDLGVSRQAAYRDLGRGNQQQLPGGGRKRPVSRTEYDG